MNKKNWAMSVLAVLFVIVACSFDQVATTLVIGGLTGLAFQVFYRRNRKAIAFALSCLLSYAMLEYFGGMIIRRQLAKTHQIDVDHRMKPNLGAGINADGIRCPFEADTVTEETFNIIFLGDSFTYGEFLEDGRDAFPAQLEAMINTADPEVPVRAVNFGWTSSSPLLSRRLLAAIGHKYKPDLVVLCLDMTDFQDDLRYLSGGRYIGVSPVAFLIREAGFIAELAQLRKRWRLGDVWRKITGSRFVVPKDRFFAVNQRLGLSLEYMAETERSIRGIHAYCKDALAADFMLICLPRSFQYSDRECPRNYEKHLYTVLGPYVEEPFKWLAALRARVDFPVYSLLEDFKNTTVFPTCLEDDPHWNRDGHRVAAEAILKILRKENLVELSRKTP